MKKHAIIPIFISHRGCPHDCVFCNQRKITSRNGDITPQMAEETINQWLTTLDNVETVEISFYGGSFTGLPLEEQNQFLKIAKKYKDLGKINLIHLSTRPDYINLEILENLKNYSVDVIELGVQSFDETVLEASGRGHNAKVIYEACRLVKAYGFTLGIQLMVGLPEDNLEKDIFSAKETVKLNPEIARLYPTVTIADTELYEMYLRGDYKPLEAEDAILRTKEMYKILHKAGINIIRVGLKSSEIMSDEIGFHPAFRQLIEGRIARDEIEDQIKKLYYPNHTFNVKIIANEKSFGNIFGHKAENRKYFSSKYAQLNFSYYKDFQLGLSLEDEEYLVQADFAPEKEKEIGAADFAPEKLGGLK